MTSHKKINIASENYRVTFPSNHCCQISIIVELRPETSDLIILFSISKARTRSCKYLFTLKFVCKEVTIIYLNQCIVMHVCWHHCINLTKI